MHTQPLFITAATLPSRSLTLNPSSSSSFTNVTVLTSPRRRHTGRQAPCMLEQNTILAIISGVAGVGGGIALMSWTETQGKRTEERANTQPCVECKGEKDVVCSVCSGSKKNPINEEEGCSYCDSVGSITCFNCGGSGIQPRFLDRLSPDDFMD